MRFVYSVAKPLSSLRISAYSASLRYLFLNSLVFSLFRQSRNRHCSAGLRRPPPSIQNLHNHHIRLQRRKIAVWLELTPQHRSQVTQRTALRLRQRSSRSSRLVFLPAVSHSQSIRANGNCITTRPIHFHILARK